MLFTLLVLIILIGELICFFNDNAYISYLQFLKENNDYSSITVRIRIVYSILYTILILYGFFCTEYFLSFLIIGGLGIIPFKEKNLFYFKIDAAICAGLLLIIFIKQLL